MNPRGSRTCPNFVVKTYARMDANLRVARARLNRPLTLAEKILYGHLRDPQSALLARGSSYLQLQPDRVAMHDISGQMALLQFMVAGRDEAAVPTTIHCDHLIQAHQGADADLTVANNANAEIYRFLSTASARYGIAFWKPGSGIIHQVLLENYAFPGGLMIGTDSHTSNAGGLGMIASGVGGADAADVMAGLPWEVKNPNIVGVRLKGRLQGWTSAKDVILKLCGMLTTKGGTGRVIEYFGEGCRSISATGKATITNMGAELGATGSVFPFDDRMAAYLDATGRSDLSELARANTHLLAADAGAFYDELYEIDLSTLEPHLVGPHSPDIARPISQVADEARRNGWPLKLSSALIGSCTNSSYEDIGRATAVAKQATASGLLMPQPFLVSPGSTRIQKTIDRDGQTAALEKTGATVLANACGPCIGQWKRDGLAKGERNTIVTSFNRNFRGRNDANAETLAFIGSPEIVTALGLAGRLDFNPLTDELEGPNGEKFRLAPPDAPEFPADGFVTDFAGFQEPSINKQAIEIDPNSDRLRKLEAFPAWNGRDFINMTVFTKVAGKCTTDHISPAGSWLRYRGHLPNISRNFLLGATNAWTGEVGASNGTSYPDLARTLNDRGEDWVLIADENYGEGSSREQAAMEARYLGCRAIIAKSFARIHESNLKKQGVLALSFVNADDFGKIGEGDRVSLLHLSILAEGSTVTLRIAHGDGTVDEIPLRHSYNAEHVEWFKAGSALNRIRHENS